MAVALQIDSIDLPEKRHSLPQCPPENIYSKKSLIKQFSEPARNEKCLVCLGQCTAFLSLHLFIHSFPPIILTPMIIILVGIVVLKGWEVISLSLATNSSSVRISKSKAGFEIKGIFKPNSLATHYQELPIEELQRELHTFKGCISKLLIILPRGRHAVDSPPAPWWWVGVRWIPVGRLACDGLFKKHVVKTNI